MTLAEYYAEKLDVEQAVGESLMELSPAQKGAEWLDDNRPGWAERVNLAHFDIEDSARCVLGQVFGADTVNLPDEDGYSYAMNKYGLEEDDYGFSASEYYHDKIELAEKATWPVAPPIQHSPSWAALQAEWQAIITERQTAGAWS